MKALPAILEDQICVSSSLSRAAEWMCDGEDTDVLEIEDNGHESSRSSFCVSSHSDEEASDSLERRRLSPKSLRNKRSYCPRWVFRVRG